MPEIINEEEQLDISIHALREEGDQTHQQYHGHHQYFYPRPPRGGRPTATRNYDNSWEFLSTPSARRATVDDLAEAFDDCIFLSTPSARRATDKAIHATPEIVISIHALREEGDTVYSPGMVIPGRFLSTPSARRATAVACFYSGGN